MEFMFGGEESNSSKVAARIDSLLNQALFLCPNIAMINSFVRLPDRAAYYYQFNPRPANAKHMKWATGALHHEEVRIIS